MSIIYPMLVVNRRAIVRTDCSLLLIPSLRANIRDHRWMLLERPNFKNIFLTKMDIQIHIQYL